MGRLKRFILAAGYILCAISLYVMPVSADTNGTELQVLEPSTLKIQLGTEWSGVEFQLKTDVGMYPGVIPVGEDGVLRLEIGGSSTYTLTCLNSDVEIPEQVEEVDRVASKKEGEELYSHTESEESAEEGRTEEDNKTPEQNQDTVAGIPITHLVLFGGGLFISIGVLIAIRVISGKRSDQYEYDDGDEDE